MVVENTYKMVFTLKCKALVVCGNGVGKKGDHLPIDKFCISIKWVDQCVCVLDINLLTVSF